MRIHRAIEWSDREREVLSRSVLAVGVGLEGDERLERMRPVTSIANDFTPLAKDRIERALVSVRAAYSLVLEESTFEHWKELAGDDWEVEAVRKMADVIVRARQDFLLDLTEAASILLRAFDVTGAEPEEIRFLDADVEGGEYRTDRKSRGEWKEGA